MCVRTLCSTSSTALSGVEAPEVMPMVRGPGLSQLEVCVHAAAEDRVSGLVLQGGCKACGQGVCRV